MSVATGATGVVVSSQQYDPWGKVRTGGVNQTKLNYTGQRRDDTGLLYYHARYYDPSLARFVSPDSIVPGASSGKGGAGGTVGAWQNSKLTVDFHESGFVLSVGEENKLTLQKGFWFQLGGSDKHKASPSGPGNPQNLSRYTYVLNNPLRYVDPTGHYDYTFDHFIGYVSKGVSAKAAMDELKRNPQKYFPFPFTPTNGCTEMKVGCTYLLDPGVPTYGPYEVTITEVTDNSFTFEVTDRMSGFAAEGSRITFSTYEKNGKVYLRQQAHTECPDFLCVVLQPLEVAGAFTRWQDMADRLYSHFAGPGAPTRYWEDKYGPS